MINIFCALNCVHILITPLEAIPENKVIGSKSLSILRLLLKVKLFHGNWSNLQFSLQSYEH